LETVAEMAAERKLAKYSSLTSNLTSQSIAVENLGAFSLSTFLYNLGHKLSSVTFRTNLLSGSKRIVKIG